MHEIQMLVRFYLLHDVWSEIKVHHESLPVVRSDLAKSGHEMNQTSASTLDSLRVALKWSWPYLSTAYVFLWVFGTMCIYDAWFYFNEASLKEQFNIWEISYSYWQPSTSLGLLSKWRIIFIQVCHLFSVQTFSPWKTEIKGQNLTLNSGLLFFLKRITSHFWLMGKSQDSNLYPRI